MERKCEDQNNAESVGKGERGKLYGTSLHRVSNQESSSQLKAKDKIGTVAWEGRDACCAPASWDGENLGAAFWGP